MDIISKLEFELDRIVEESEVPGAELAEALASLIEQGLWDALRKVVGDNGVRQIRDSYNADPVGYVRLWRDAAAACRTRLGRGASKHLTRLTCVNFSSPEAQDLAEWISVALDPKREVLSVAFAYRLVELIRFAAGRASELRDLVVAEASSPAADDYLSEACECYFFGLYTASAVMCRSLMEEALERKVPTKSLKEWEHKSNGKLTLGSLISKVEKECPSCVPPRFLALAKKVKDVADRAAHKEAIGQLDSGKCLRDAREAITVLLTSP